MSNKVRIMNQNLFLVLKYLVCILRVDKNSVPIYEVNINFTITNIFVLMIVKLKYLPTFLFIYIRISHMLLYLI